MASAGQFVDPNTDFSDKVKKVYIVTPGRSLAYCGAVTAAGTGSLIATIILNPVGSFNYLSELNINAPACGSLTTFQIHTGSPYTSANELYAGGPKYLVAVPDGKFVCENCPNIASGSVIVKINAQASTSLTVNAKYKYDTLSPKW